MTKVGQEYKPYESKEGSTISKYTPKVLLVLGLVGAIGYFSGKLSKENQEVIDNKLEYVAPLINKADSLVGIGQDSLALDFIRRSRIYLQNEKNKLLEDNDFGYINTKRIDNKLGELKDLEARINEAN